MKIVKRMFAALFAFALILGSTWLNAPVSAAGGPVELIKASIYSYKFGFTSFSGDIEVQNLAYQKNVTIHYSPGDGQWYDTSASYARPADASHEIWHFDISTHQMTDEHPELKNADTIQFAIKYEVNGQTYWDNNGNQNYSVSRYNMESVILGAPQVLRLNELLTNGIFNGNLFVKNEGYAKTVKIVYTTDNWQTTHEGQAYYYGAANGSNSVESWSFGIYVDPNAAQIKYAISYSVNGQTYWDNNYGNNYTVNK
ncbi:hypothetical protein [Paenibacillus sp. SI8]|uniref:hypothetical protein n=1 Tax=unclassified Paenibacillus TaxID=185978 RepID=UPI003467284D